MKSFLKCSAPLLALGLSAITAMPASAQNTWLGAGPGSPSSGNWNVAGNWSDGVVPDASSTIVAAGGSAYTITLNASSNSAGVFYAASPNTTVALAGNNLSLGTFLELQGGTTVFDGGAGGSITASGGYLQLGETSATDNNNTVTVQNGASTSFLGILEGNEQATSGNTLTFKGGSSFTGGRVAIADNAAGTGTGNSLLVTGAGTSFTQAGNAPLNIGAGGGTGGSNTFTVDSGATYNTGGLITINSSSDGSNAFTVSNGATATIGGSTSGNYGVLNNGGQFNISGGTVNLTGFYIPNAPGSTITFSSGTLNLVGNSAGDPVYFVLGNGLSVGDGVSSAKAVLNLSNSNGSGVYFGAGVGTAMRIQANGVVTGTGSASGLALTYDPASTIAPGVNSTTAAPGTTGIGTGTLTLDHLDATSGATFKFDLGAGALTEVLALNQMDVEGGGTGTLEFDLHDLGATVGTTYTLMTLASEFNGDDIAADSFVGLGDGITGIFGTDALHDDLTFTVLSNSNIVMAPEPGTYALLLAGGFALVLYHRGKSRRIV